MVTSLKPAIPNVVFAVQYRTCFEIVSIVGLPWLHHIPSLDDVTMVI
jgi:hypothetical protein